MEIKETKEGTKRKISLTLNLLSRTYTNRRKSSEEMSEQYLKIKEKFDNIDWIYEDIRQYTFEILRTMEIIFFEAGLDYYQANAIRELLLEILHASDVGAMQQFFLMDVLNDERNFDRKTDLEKELTRKEESAADIAARLC